MNEKTLDSSFKIEKGLHLVATPIGNADDITLRAIYILTHADILLAEDTRVLRKLMDIHAIPQNGRKMISYHDHNGAQQRPYILEHLKNGKSIAFTSDAGMPLIADPGYNLSMHVIKAGYKLHAAPGASALLTALCLAGQPTDSFFFGGFLGSKSSIRIKKLNDIKTLNTTLVFYETAKRCCATLQDMKTILGDDRHISLCRELTKKFEEIICGTIQDVLHTIEKRPSLKGEIVLVLAPPMKKTVDDDFLNEKLINLLHTETVKDVATSIAQQYNIPRKRVYKLAQYIKDQMK